MFSKLYVTLVLPWLLQALESRVDSDRLSGAFLIYIVLLTSVFVRLVTSFATPRLAFALQEGRLDFEGCLREVLLPLVLHGG